MTASILTINQLVKKVGDKIFVKNFLQRVKISITMYLIAFKNYKRSRIITSIKGKFYTRYDKTDFLFFSHCTLQAIYRLGQQPPEEYKNPIIVDSRMSFL